MNDITPEQAQDEALAVAAQFRLLCKDIDDNQKYVMTGKELKKLCDAFETTANSLARLVYM